ncbi:MAG: rhomboid family intramembrane serine protease [Bacteroidales bacterium]|nr:rhomboid family intramembrane serine protease [Bacteroidales bacterium]
MASFWDSLVQKYKQGTIVLQLIYINVGVFLLLRLTLLLLGMFRVDADWLMPLFQMPSDWMSILMRPWTVFTYMFVHLGLMHIFFNMLWLYFFGGMFLHWFNPRQLGGLYILGGLFGGLFFALFNNLLPMQEGIQGTVYLMGASASVLALGIAVAFYRPDEPIRIFLFGSLKLKYLAIIMVVLDVLSLNGDNAGGSLAHLGGALAGLVFGYSLRRGVDLTAWVNPILDWFVNLMPRRRKMKITYKRPKREETYKTADVDQKFRDKKKQDSDQMDAILDKIKQSGYESLSQEEKKKLFDFSRK